MNQHGSIPVKLDLQKQVVGPKFAEYSLSIFL